MSRGCAIIPSHGVSDYSLDAFFADEYGPSMFEVGIIIAVMICRSYCSLARDIAGVPDLQREAVYVRRDPPGKRPAAVLSYAKKRGCSAR